MVSESVSSRSFVETQGGDVKGATPPAPSSGSRRPGFDHGLVSDRNHAASVTPVEAQRRVAVDHGRGREDSGSFARSHLPLAGSMVVSVEDRDLVERTEHPSSRSAVCNPSIPLRSGQAVRKRAVMLHDQHRPATGRGHLGSVDDTHELRPVQDPAERQTGCGITVDNATSCTPSSSSGWAAALVRRQGPAGRAALAAMRPRRSMRRDFPERG